MFRLFKKKKPSDESIDKDLVEDLKQDVNTNSESNSELNTNTVSDEIQNLEPEVVEEVPEKAETFSEQVVNFENKQSKKTSAEEIDETNKIIIETEELAVEQPAKKKGLFQRLKSGLSKTSNTLTEGMNSLVLGKKKIDDEVLEELETRLLMADVGMEATQRIIKDLTQRS